MCLLLTVRYRFFCTYRVKFTYFNGALVLQCAAEYVKGRHLPSIFTFPKAVVLHWFAKAKHACAQSCYIEDEQYYGGPPFALMNSTTHWTDPSQLFTWWKNNIERKAKYTAMLSEAFYTGLMTANFIGQCKILQ